MSSANDLKACMGLLKQLTARDITVHDDKVTVVVNGFYEMQMSPYRDRGFYIRLVVENRLHESMCVLSDAEVPAAFVEMMNAAVRGTEIGLETLKIWQARAKVIKAIPLNNRNRQRQCFDILSRLGFDPEANGAGNPVAVLTDEYSLALFPWDTVYDKMDYDGTATGFGLEIIWVRGGHHPCVNVNTEAEIPSKIQFLLDSVITTLEMRNGITPLRSIKTRLARFQGHHTLEG